MQFWILGARRGTAVSPCDNIIQFHELAQCRRRRNSRQNTRRQCTKVLDPGGCDVLRRRQRPTPTANTTIFALPKIPSSCLPYYYTFVGLPINFCSNGFVNLLDGFGIFRQEINNVYRSKILEIFIIISAGPCHSRTSVTTLRDAVNVIDSEAYC